MKAAGDTQIRRMGYGVFFLSGVCAMSSGVAVSLYDSGRNPQKRDPIIMMRASWPHGKKVCGTWSAIRHPAGK